MQPAWTLIGVAAAETQAIFLVGAFLERSARLLQWLSMYHFLVQTLIGLGGTQRSRVRVPASPRKFFIRLRSFRH